MQAVQWITARTGGSRLAAGVAASLAVHGALVLAYRAERPVENFRLVPRVASLWVRVQPPPAAIPAASRPALPSPARRPAQRPGPPRLAAPVATLAPAPQPDVPAPAADAGTVPQFSLDDARLTARQFAGEPVVSASGRVVRQEIVPETPLARGIVRAERRDCKDGVPGGLLAPLLLLLDKKDHGCKW